MAETETKKAVKTIVSDIEALKELKKELDILFEPETNQREKDFQLRLLELEQGGDVLGSFTAIIASIFVALITATLTLTTTLSQYISVNISTSLIIFQIIAAVVTIVVMWIIFILFRNWKISKIEKDFGIQRQKKSKAKKTSSTES